MLEGICRVSIHKTNFLCYNASMKIKHTLLIILFVTLFMSVAALAVIGINKLSKNLSN